VTPSARPIIYGQRALVE